MPLVAAVDDKDTSPWLQSGLALVTRMPGVWRKVYIQVEDIHLQGKDNLFHRNEWLFP